MKNATTKNGQQGIKASNTKELAPLATEQTKDQLIKECYATIKHQEKVIADYQQALETSRENRQKIQDQLKKQTDYFNELQELREWKASHEQKATNEPIIEHLLKQAKNSFNLQNYFEELFIIQQFGTASRKDINITTLELSLLFGIKWKFAGNNPIQIFNTDYKIGENGLYNIKFNVDTSLMSNEKISHYNRDLEKAGVFIPLNTLTAEEKEQLQAQDRETVVIER